MPYATLQALPDWVRKQMPKAAQEIYKSAFNAALKTYNGHEGKAAATAVAAVKAKYKKVGEMYVAKAEEHLLEIKPDEGVLVNLSEAKFEYDPVPVIRNVALLGLESKNGVPYLAEAIEGGVDKYEGARMFYNHPSDPKKRHQDVRDLLGKAKNVHFESESSLLRGDSFILNTPDRVAFMKALEQMPDIAGFSPHHQVWTRKTARGTEEAFKIENVHSIDLVTHPATTKSLFEHIEDKKEAEDMELSKLTLKDLQEQRPDLVAALCEENKDVINLETLKTQNAELKATNTKLERTQKIDAAVKEAKVPQELDGEVFRQSLARAENDEEMKAIIKDRTELAAKLPKKANVISAGKNEDTPSKGPTKEEILKKLKPNRLVD